MSESSVKKYDVVVLGSGEGGKYIAWTLAKQGKRVAVIERRYIGGSCPNIACLPSKNVIHSAKVASYFYRSEEFGISKENVRINMPAVREHKRKMVDALIQMHLDNYKASGAELILGSGRFVGTRRRLRLRCPMVGRCWCAETRLSSAPEPARPCPRFRGSRKQGR